MLLDVELQLGGLELQGVVGLEDKCWLTGESMVLVLGLLMLVEDLDPSSPLITNATYDPSWLVPKSHAG